MGKNFDDCFKLRDELGEVWSTIDELAMEVSWLKGHPCIDEDYKLQDWHEFDREQLSKLQSSLDEALVQWNDFYKGRDRQIKADK